MKKVIMFAIVALLAAPGNIIMARKNTASTIIKETRNEPLTFYVNITNRQTAKRTFKKSMKKAQKDMLDAYGDSISVDSIMSMLPISSSTFEVLHRTSRVKCEILVGLDNEIKDFAAELDKSHDTYPQFELNSAADTIYLEGRNKEIAKAFANMMPENSGMAFYYTNEPFVLSPGVVVVTYSPKRNVQSIVHFRRRPFRIFF
jgi:hypothetical protein